MRVRWTGLMGFCLAASAVATAQPFGASGAVFRVNSTTAGNQWYPSVGIDGSGSFLIAWEHAGNGIRAQRFSAAGQPLASEFRVDTPTGYNYVASVAGGPAGFVVAWQRTFLGQLPSVYARRVLQGAPEGAELRVNSGTGALNRRPSIAADASGNFVVAWHRAATMNGTYTVWGRRFTADATPLVDDFRVNTSTTNAYAGAPSVARAADGTFLVAWAPDHFPGAVGTVFGSRFAADGSPAGGGPAAANDAFSTTSQRPAVAFDGAGGQIVVWAGGQVYGRRYAASGASLGDVFRVDTSTAGAPPIDVAVSADATGGFVVVWSDTSSGYEILARRFASSGAPIGEPFSVTASTSGSPRLGKVASAADGDFVVTWATTSGNPDVFARLYCASLAGDANGDGAITVADVLYLINNLFAGGPDPLRGSDANGDGNVTVSDVLFLINHLFAGGPAPACV